MGWTVQDLYFNVDKMYSLDPDKSHEGKPYATRAEVWLYGVATARGYKRTRNLNLDSKFKL